MCIDRLRSDILSREIAPGTAQMELPIATLPVGTYIFAVEDSTNQAVRFATTR